MISSSCGLWCVAKAGGHSAERGRWAQHLKRVGVAVARGANVIGRLRVALLADPHDGVTIAARAFTSLIRSDRSE